ncbi:MAG: PstS family phosphate ABC transporter substrate-binding protein [Chloroflexota bacterium]|nr:PstS family phosphate ABC transporter substrate-binding protein [Chloroflexota bacterium]
MDTIKRQAGSRRWRRIFGLLAIGAVLAVLAVACGPAATPTPTAAPTATPTPMAGPTPTPTPRSTPTPTPVKLSGTIEIDGSSTVFPITQAVAEEFSKVQPGVRVNVGISGTGGGFKRFTVGEIDISDASRPISASEVAAAQKNGIEYIELEVAIDGLSVMVNPQNDFVSCLTVSELKKIWAPGSTVKNWKDVRAGFPDRPLVLYGPDTDSGTFDYFTEEIMGKAKASRADYTASADDNVLVQGINGDRNSLGYFGYAYYVENPGKLKLVAVDQEKGKGCVTPTPETIENGTYTPLARPLYIYVSKKSLARPEMKEFVKFYLENAPKLVKEVGYIPLPVAKYQEGLSKTR